MTIQKSINLAIASFIAILAAALLLVTYSVSAQEANVEEVTPVTTQEETTEEPAEEAGEEPAEEVQEETTEELAVDAGTFDYVAQSGDSYSLIARKAVQTYGAINSVDLTGAQIIFIETNLTLAAGSPVLNLGDNVSVEGKLIAEWVERAKSLTEVQQAAWQVYADFANFNTDAVGEARE